MQQMPQVRVLYRQFLFRLMDVEMLSGSARGDASTLLGQIGSLLIFASLMMTFGAVTGGQELRHTPSAPAVWAVERFFVSLTMMVIGIFALLSWDATFLDRRDVLVLAPLPVRGRTLFLAKIAAAASALGLVVGALYCLGGLAWPFMLTPPGSGLIATLRVYAAFWISIVAAGVFLYCALLGVQAAAAQLPRRWYLRISSILQIAAFCLLLGVFCFQPTFRTASDLGAPENQRALAWLPTYWFMGLMGELSGTYVSEGHAVIGPLASRAVRSLAVAILVAGSAFALSYFRTLRKIVEEPDIVPSARGGIRLPRFGSLPQTALMHFVIRTLLRSRQHRMLLTFYLGGGFAIVTVYIQVAREEMRLTSIDVFHTVNVPMLVSSTLILCAAWLGTRTMFSLPLDLRANWIFRLTPPLAPPACLAATRCALLTLSVLPVTIASAVVLLCFWPCANAFEHVAFLVALGSLIAEISLIGFEKIPFTCSYLPGKSKVNMVFWFGIVPVIVIIHKLAEWEQSVMANPPVFWTTVGALGVAVFVLRRIAAPPMDTKFEDTPSDELITLGLSGL